ncbi:MAG: transcription elongation protein SprT [Cyclobacteriaceae bacterium]
MDPARSVFERFVPAPAVDYCAQLYHHLNFEFKVKRSRKTKFGDFRFDPRIKKYTITVNNDLNPYAFLITYLHEVAHLVTSRDHGRKVLPHGKEWKANFKKATLPVLNDQVFPKEVLQSLAKYLINPKASSCSDPILYQVLKQYDAPSDKVLLKTLQPGDEFEFNGKIFKYLSKRRTRIECIELKTNRHYLINQVAEILRV